MPYRPEPKKIKRLQSTKKSWKSTDFDYQSKDWRRLRKTQLTEHPLCKMCLDNGKVTAAKVADHIKPILEGGEAWDIENLQSLCETCHRVKTGKEIAKRNK